MKLFILLVILCCLHSSISFSDKTNDVETIAEAKQYIGECLTDLTNELPSMFCWKKNNERIIPTNCPEGYFRYGALCYQNCKENYSFHLGVCYEDCSSDQKDYALFCKNPLKVKKSYIPSSITNLSSAVTCPEGLIKSGALCYSNCKRIGMFNCGGEACSSSKATCGLEIAKMVIKSIGKIMTIHPFFGKLPIKVTILLGKFIKKIAEKKLFSVLSKVLQEILSHIQERIQIKLKELATKVSHKLPFVKDETKAKICGALYNYINDTLFSKPVRNPKVSDLPKMVNALSFLNVDKAYDSCKGIDKVECAQNIFKVIDAIDLTGLLSFPGIFIYHRCQMPPRILDKIQTLLHSEQSTGCATFYSEQNFEGSQLRQFCDIPQVSLIADDENINLREGTKSIKITDGNFLFFSDSNFKGDRLFIHKNKEITDINKIAKIKKGIEYQYKHFMKSAMRTKDECVYMFYKDTQNRQKTLEICDDKKLNLNLDFVSDVSFHVFSKNVIKFTLYNSTKPNPNSIIIETSTKYKVDKSNGYTTIGFISINSELNSFGFLCKHEADTKQYIRYNKEENNIECLSIDGKKCLTEKISDHQCKQLINYHENEIVYRPCIKSKKILRKYFQQWCEKGKKYFHLSE